MGLLTQIIQSEPPSNPTVTQGLGAGGGGSGSGHANLSKAPKPNFSMNVANGYGLPRLQLENEYLPNGKFDARVFGNVIATHPSGVGDNDTKGQKPNKNPLEPYVDPPPTKVRKILSPREATKKLLNMFGMVSSCIICQSTKQTINHKKYAFDKAVLNDLAREGEFIGEYIIDSIGDKIPQLFVFGGMLMMATSTQVAKAKIEQAQLKAKAAKKAQKTTNKAKNTHKKAKRRQP